MNWDKFLIAIMVGVFAWVGWLTYRDLRGHQQSTATSLAFMPGHLSQAHAFLENKCVACHTPNRGVLATACISCHANNQTLLGRQSTGFHASVTSCKECHQEHQGGGKPPLSMNHLALAKIGAETHAKELEGVSNQLVRDYEKAKHFSQMSAEMVPLNPHEPAIVSGLNCISCHGTRDKHQGLFGNSCLSCHHTESWRIAEYKHPSPNSRDCVQCHQAPPSHYMEHFRMISMTVARQEHANVTQCYLCHQTTSWNDIKGVGWYKHH